MEHELRSLKDIIDKHDLDRNTGRSVQKDIDEILSHREIEKDEPFIVSPRNITRRKLKLGVSMRSLSLL